MSSEDSIKSAGFNNTTGQEKDLTKAWVMAGILMFAYTLSFLDRSIITLLITPIKLEFGLTDFQASLLLGPAFAISYTVMGIPLGWAADRFSRTKLLAFWISFWSIMTAFCGLSSTFIQMFMARIGIGVGEASLTPTAVSLLSDKFPKSKLPLALSLYSMGVFVGGGIAMIGGAHVLEALEGMTISIPLIGTLEYWQIGFLIAGTPGILLAIIFYFLKEPKRKEMALDDKGEAKKTSMAETFKYLWKHKKLFICFFIGGSFISVIGHSGDWYPEYFMRTWQWSRSEAGEATGYPQILGGTAGLILAGIYISHLIKNGIKDAPIRIAFWGTVGISIPAVIMPLMPEAIYAAITIIFIKFFVGFPLICGTTLIRMAVPNQMRGQFTAIYFIFVGLISVNLGPVIPAFITTYIFNDNLLMLKYSLSITAAIAAPIGSILIWISWQEYKKMVYANED